MTPKIEALILEVAKCRAERDVRRDEQNLADERLRLAEEAVDARTAALGRAIEEQIEAAQPVAASQAATDGTDDDIGRPRGPSSVRP